MLDPRTLDQKARSLGFALTGAVDYRLAKPLYLEQAKRYVEWVDQGHAQGMSYLERGLPRRLDPTEVFPALKSVFVALYPYGNLREEPQEAKYAKYLQGEDYHKVLKRKLKELFRETGIQYKVCVDTSAVLERTWAHLCGLGWIGKNKCLIHPQLGSHFFIGVVFLDRELGLGPRPMASLCGHCDACLRGCPTQAFEKDQLVSERCISYLTLESREPFGPQTPEWEGWIAGCDVCQDVCPFNQKWVRKGIQHGELGGVDATALSTWSKLMKETEEDYSNRIATSSLKRVKFFQFRRNLEWAQSANRTP